MMCGTTCTNLNADSANCGRCGAPCSAGQVCRSGVCTTEGGGACLPPLTSCAGNCVDLQTNPSNCGACNMSCGGRTCSGGRCV